MIKNTSVNLRSNNTNPVVKIRTNQLDSQIKNQDVVSKIKNSGVNVAVKNQVVENRSSTQTNVSQAKNLVVDARVSTVIPNFNNRAIIISTRADNAQAVTVIEGSSGGGVSFGGKGYMIGMMALTYIAAQVTATTTTIQVTYVGPKPNLRINNG